MASLNFKEVSQKRSITKLSRKFWAIPRYREKRLKAVEDNESPFLSLDTRQEGLDHERVLEKKFDLRLISISAYAS